jgi:hypothetical protein
MISAEPENMPELVRFDKSVNILPDDKVENWLGRIEETMVSSLKVIANQTYAAYPMEIKKRRDWMFDDFPAQIVLLVEITKWQELISAAIMATETHKDSMKVA